MSAIYTLWLREIKRYVRSRAQIVASLGQPLLYLVALGFGLGPVFQRAGNGNYIQFVAPGVIGMSVLFTSIFSGIGLLWDRQFGFLKETLVAPVPRFQIMLGRTLGGATVAVCQGLLVVVVCIVTMARTARTWATGKAVKRMAPEEPASQPTWSRNGATSWQRCLTIAVTAGSLDSGSSSVNATR